MIGTTETNICIDPICDCPLVENRDVLAILTNDSIHQQIGVKSFDLGANDCNIGKPIVYTQIYPYLDWISSVTGLQLK